MIKCGLVFINKFHSLEIFLGKVRQVYSFSYSSLEELKIEMKFKKISEDAYIDWIILIRKSANPTSAENIWISKIKYFHFIDIII